jgi:3-methyladenine DNA glycosylase AlkD
VPFTTNLETTYYKYKNSENAIPMAKYTKNLFSFYGIKAEQRREIFKEICKENKEELTQNSREIAWELCNKEFRELHYCGIEIIMKYLKKKYQKEDIELIEKILVTNSCWDSVDTIAKNILGQYLIEFP